MFTMHCTIRGDDHCKHNWVTHSGKCCGPKWESCFSRISSTSFLVQDQSYLPPQESRHTPPLHLNTFLLSLKSTSSLFFCLCLFVLRPVAPHLFIYIFLNILILTFLCVAHNSLQGHPCECFGTVSHCLFFFLYWVNLTNKKSFNDLVCG